jgi:hypothetical protein
MSSSPSPSPSSSSSSPPNASVSFVIFLVITLIYTVIKVRTKKESKTGLLLIYFFVVIIVQYFINLSLTEFMCGANNFGLALSVTTIPWILIFGMINIMLIIFPGWVAPFSNTFGYLAAKLSGVNKLVESLLKKKGNDNTPDMNESLDYLYNDKALFVNEITERNLDQVWSRMSKGGLFNPDIVNDTSKKDQLESIIKLKTAVGELIWYILAGGLVTSVSYNYLVNTACVQSVNEMQDRHAAYETQAHKNYVQTTAAKKDKKTYVSYD